MLTRELPDGDAWVRGEWGAEEKQIDDRRLVAPRDARVAESAAAIQRLHSFAGGSGSSSAEKTGAACA